MAGFLENFAKRVADAKASLPGGSPSAYLGRLETAITPPSAPPSEVHTWREAATPPGDNRTKAVSDEMAAWHRKCAAQKIALRTQMSHADTRCEALNDKQFSAYLRRGSLKARHGAQVYTDSAIAPQFQLADREYRDSLSGWYDSFFESSWCWHALHGMPNGLA